MPIKNFRRREKLKPLVEVGLGAIVPKGCKNLLIYAESPHDNKCVNQIDGECPFINKEKGVWKKNTQACFCPMARMSEKQLFQRGYKTRPMQLGYFSMPEEYRVQLGLPPRPTEIPNICLISDHNIERHGLVEPLETLMCYPVFDYYLAWWTASDCICKGDGEVAHRFPYSPANENHMKQRACAYRDCPDFDGKYKCKTVGELYFRLPETPGYPGLWRITTRSPRAIENIIMELEQLHTALNGVVSRVPLKLTIEEEVGRPIVDGKKLKTKVFRLHIRTDITMEQAAEFKRQIAKQVVAGKEILAIAAATSETAPPPARPVETEATAPPEQWDDESVDVPEGKKAPTAPKTPKVTKPAAAAQPPAAQPPDPLVEAHAVEDRVIAAFKLCNNGDELKACLLKHKNKFVEYKEAGFKPVRAQKALAELRAKFEAQAAGAASKAPKAPKAPAPPAPPAAKKGVDGEMDGLRRKVKGLAKTEPPIFEESAAVAFINEWRTSTNNPEKATSIDDFDKAELAEIIKLAEKS